MPKGTKIVPTVTLVFYYGDEAWDAPKMPDEEIDRFDGDLKAFLLMIQENLNRKS